MNSSKCSRNATQTNNNSHIYLNASFDLIDRDKNNNNWNLFHGYFTISSLLRSLSHLLSCRKKVWPTKFEYNLYNECFFGVVQNEYFCSFSIFFTYSRLPFMHLIKRRWYWVEAYFDNFNTTACAQYTLKRCMQTKR